VILYVQMLYCLLLRNIDKFELLFFALGNSYCTQSHYSLYRAGVNTQIQALNTKIPNFCRINILYRIRLLSDYVNADSR